MASVSETELKQKASDFINFVKDYAVNHDKDFKLVDKREGFIITIFGKDCTLDFTI